MELILRCQLVALLILVAGVAECCADGAREDRPASWRVDAELTDVFFLNERLGWAVGSQGVILRTIDGGKNWTENVRKAPLIGTDYELLQKFRNPQPVESSHVDSDRMSCRFESVFFTDEMNGWVAGGYEVPIIGKSRAVILRTQDGGVTWKRVKGLVMPRLNKIYFNSRKHGWAAGNKSNLYPTGAFYTSDGGATWSANSKGEQRNWIAASPTVSGFATIDTNGNPALVTASSFENAVVLDRNAGALRNLILPNKRTGWAVGDEGTLLKTENGGIGWKKPSELERVSLREFDFKALAVSESKVWVAGSPGTRVFSIDRVGGKITQHQIPIQSPINALFFTNDQQGWAVGALGNILATVDGGKTWQSQRGSQSTVSILCVGDSIQSLPLSPILNAAGENNFLTAVTVLNPNKTANELALVQQSTERLGASLCLDQSGSRAEKEQVQARTMSRLVRQIRTLQPRLLIVGGERATEETIKEAVQLAAEPTAFSNQILNAGLQPWRVSAIAFQDSRGDIKIGSNRMLPRLGKLNEDVLANSHALLGRPVRDQRDATFRVTKLKPGVEAKRMIMGGSTSIGNLPTRKVKREQRGSLAVIKFLAGKNKNLNWLASVAVQTPQERMQWSRQVQILIGNLDENIAGIWLVNLADLCMQNGNVERVATTLQLLSDRYPDHAFAPAAMTWLVQHYASEEVALAAGTDPQVTLQAQHQHQTQQVLSPFAKVTTFQSPDGQFTQTRWHDRRDPKLADSIEADASKEMEQDPPKLDAEALTLDPEEEEPEGEKVKEISPEELKAWSDAIRDSRIEGASRFMSRLRAHDPDLALDPRIYWIDAQLKRKKFGFPNAENLLSNIAKSVSTDREAFSAITGARREVNLHDPSRYVEESQDAIACIQVKERPHLDGKLDDAIWQRGSSLSFQHGGLVDEVMLRHDREFLYIGVVCQKISGQTYDSPTQSQQRDADLSQRDRFEITLDTDRDYQSTFKLTVDYRGWAGDRCGQDADWNPNWYISRHLDEKTWTLEIAIPFSQLTSKPVSAGDPWAVQLKRLRYDSVDLWSGLIDSPPQGFTEDLFGDADRFKLLRF